jgi:hypothetical protein
MKFTSGNLRGSFGTADYAPCNNGFSVFALSDFLPLIDFLGNTIPAM